MIQSASDIAALQQELERRYLEASRKGIWDYLQCLTIDTRPPQRFKDLIKHNPWQADLINILAPIFEAATGHKPKTKSNVYVTAGRGHGKTSLFALLSAWALCFAKYPVKMYAAAGDKDQANILTERMQAEAAQNPWLAKLLTSKVREVQGPSGTLEVLTSDAPTSTGLIADVYLIDELTSHKSRKLWDALLSGKDKRPDAAWCVISNAGIKGTWQHDILRTAQQDPKRWVVHEIPALSASWLNREDIEAQRPYLIPAEFKRLHLNEWCDQNEENAFVLRYQIENCVTSTQQTEGRGHKYIMAADYASVHDRTAAAVMHMEDDDVYLDDLKVWQGKPEDRMQIERLEQWLTEKMQSFDIRRLILDPYQLESTAQKFEKKLPVERFSFGGSHHYQLAENLRSLIVTRRLHIYPKAGPLTLPDGTIEDLVEEITQLVIEEKGQGRWRFNHLPGKHDDRAIVLALASLALVRQKRGTGVWLPPEPIPSTPQGPHDWLKMQSEAQEILDRRARGEEDHLLWAGLD